MNAVMTLLRSARRLGLRDAAPAGPAAAGPFQGYVDERSTHHVAGWVRNLSNPAERVAYEVAVVGPEENRVLFRGVADRFSPVLQTLGVGDATYAFYVLLPVPVSEAQRDWMVVRPAATGLPLELAPALLTAFQPISHVAMDIVDNCNLRCPFCVYDYAHTRTTHFMTEATFETALQLIPFVTEGNFWLSCLHEATLHPDLLRFIDKVPMQYRSKLFYTTNLAKRMPAEYFAAVADSGMHHLNISIESFDPTLYERMRKGARHRIFAQNWEALLAALPAGRAPPRLRYNIMAYRSNLAEIPQMIDVLLGEKKGWQVEIRATFDEAHIPQDFKDSEYLAAPDWDWLRGELARHDPERVLLLAPPAAPEAAPAPAAAAPASPTRVPRPLNIRISYDGSLYVYGEQPGQGGEPPTQQNFVVTNINWLGDPLKMLLAL